MSITDTRRDQVGGDAGDGPTLEVGTHVEVRSTLDRRWSRGFEVREVAEGGYRVRRLSDMVDLPGVIAAADVRKEKRRGTWWY
ncbi:MAG: hypothetical protein U0Q07_19270 [Acidimicrobiales bacterium]